MSFQFERDTKLVSNLYPTAFAYSSIVDSCELLITGIEKEWNSSVLVFNSRTVEQKTEQANCKCYVVLLTLTLMVS